MPAAEAAPAAGSSVRRAETVICGAGVTGLSLARELVARGAGDILVIEKEPEPGRHASGRNSGVLHAGIYYTPDSLKARFCQEGNRAMRAYCREHGLPLLENGKVVVARDESQLPTLEELHRRATACGARVQMIDERRLAEIEPAARSTRMALHSLDTAVVDPRAILHCLHAELEATGKVRFCFNTRATGLEDDRTLATTAGPVRFSRLANAAGAYADRLARAFGLAGRYQLVPFKGLYRRLTAERSDLVRGSIYPVPDIRNPFLGVHFTRGVSGRVYLGPTSIPALGRENYGVLAGLDAECASILWRDAVLFLTNRKFRRIALTEPRKYLFKHFFADAAGLVQELSPEDIEPSSKVGIRPQLVDLRTGELVMDFVIERTDTSVHVLNAISPAFTGGFSFARMVADELERSA
ncbi:MAG: L-2-hydroxyglutarate oxidase [Desulfovibrionaceae bacterium]